MSELATQYYDDVAAVDFETYFDSKYTLFSKTQSMTEYIRDERFEAQTIAITLASTGETLSAVGHKDIKELLHSIDWASTAWLSHHTHFDGYIGTHHFDTYPVFWLDNMPISRLLWGADVGHSHAALAARLGIEAKSKGDALQDVKGVRLADMSPEQIAGLRAYNEDDAREELEVFKKIWRLVPFDELRVIDIKLRMYCEPVIDLDGGLLRALHEREVGRRDALIAETGVGREVLGSAPKLADLLRSLGVEPPMKISPRTGKSTFAFAKTDLEFKALLDHPNETVRKVVEARLGSKSTIVASRAERFIRRVGLPSPVYIAPNKARTLRDGGGDLVNYQNLPAVGAGADIRLAQRAPQGCKMIGGDASQVEARMTAWLAGFVRKLEAFSAYDNNEGPDMYCLSAEPIFGRPIDKFEDPFERFIGKVLELSCQYGAGATKIKNTLAQGFRGAEPVFLSLDEVKRHVKLWRRANGEIVQYWRSIETAAKLAWLSKRPQELGALYFEYSERTDRGFIHLPSGVFLIYNSPHRGLDGEMYYTSKNGPTKLWGGHLLENVSQALCGMMLKHHMLEFQDAAPDARIVLPVHDEIVSVAYEHQAEEYAQTKQRVMSTPMDCFPGLPLNASVWIGNEYQKE